MRNIPAIQPTTSIASSAQNPSFFRSFQAWYHSSLTWNSSPFLESLRNRSMSIKHNILSRPSSAMTLATDDNTGPLLQLVLERRIQAVWTTCSRCAADNGVNASNIQALCRVMARKLSYLYLAMGNVHWLLGKGVQFELCCGSFRVACFYLRSCKVLLLYSSYQFTYGGYSFSLMSLWVKAPQWKVFPIV